MDTRSYDLRRAEQERYRASRALTEEARQTHLELAAIFDARAGVTNVVAFPAPRHRGKAG